MCTVSGIKRGTLVRQKPKRKQDNNNNAQHMVDRNLFNNTCFRGVRYAKALLKIKNGNSTIVKEPARGM